MSLNDLINKIQPVVKAHAMRMSAPWPRYTLFISMSDSKQRATVLHACGESFDQTWQYLIEQAMTLAKKRDLGVIWLRVDWVRSVREASLGQLKEWLKRVKRNYFRYGLAFDRNFAVAFLEQELNANAMLYGGTQYAHAVFNEKNFLVYARRRYEKFRQIFSDDIPIYMLDTAGVFCSITEGPELLHPKGRQAGRRIINRLTAKDVYGLIDRSSKYLAEQALASGRFEYGWHPCFDRRINTYNTLRHASSTYSMVEAWEVTKNADLHEAIIRSLNYMISDLIKIVTLPDGVRAAFLLEHTGTEIKLGANAVCILAFSKYAAITGTTQYHPLLEQLALGIQYMQNPTTGKFVHVLNFPALSVKEEFRIIYYDGEAAFGLMRLYGLTKDARWLAVVEKAFEYFIVAEHWQNHDHWLSYCVNELTLYREEEKYYRFGVQNVAGYLDFIENRITTFPTLLELMMAAERMVTRLSVSSKYSHLLKDIDIHRFYYALEKRAHYLLNGHFWPEYAMFFSNPRRISGSFFIRHHAFRVRIDDVEHYLSGFVAYNKYLKMAESELRRNSNYTGGSLSDEKMLNKLSGSSRVDESQAEDAILTAEWLERKTNGIWMIRPGIRWQAKGVCVHTSRFSPGALLCARGEKSDRFLSRLSLGALVSEGAAGIICESPALFLDMGVPVLCVPDMTEAILSIGRAAREHYKGDVVGVTGTAGKTTVVAMISHVMRTFGDVENTVGSANLPVGIAWNQASMSQDASCWVLEMAVGRMAENSDLVKPQVAVITNIGAAHLHYHISTENIAIKKARIINAMSPGGVVVVSRDIEHFELIATEARRHRLKIITYGEHEKADVRMQLYKNSKLKGNVFGEAFELINGAAGSHMAHNALAVIAVMVALKKPWRSSLYKFQSFVPIEGRGAAHNVLIDGKNVTLINDAYNANPLSMAAAFETVSHSMVSSEHRVFVLADMLELGANSKEHHEALAYKIVAARPSRVLLYGKEMANLWKLILPEVAGGRMKGKWFSDLVELSKELPSWLEEGDTVLFKGSNSMGLQKIIMKWAH